MKFSICKLWPSLFLAVKSNSNNLHPTGQSRFLISSVFENLIDILPNQSPNAPEISFFSCTLFQLTFSLLSPKTLKYLTERYIPLREQWKFTLFFFINSATRPFGMVKSQPWNTDDRRCLGIRFGLEVKLDKGLSHVPNAWQLSRLSVLPVSNVNWWKGEDFGSPFARKQKKIVKNRATNQVMLDRNGIKVELTSTLRTGFAIAIHSRTGSQQVDAQIREGPLGLFQDINWWGAEFKSNPNTPSGSFDQWPYHQKHNNTPIFLQSTQ